ncbi:ROK family protein [Aeoliella sp. ICT_H6.2]|uniref:ROK family protein n=1 Tax=Aeoliella straminimaris TaxID=2954799 RepID=A0A9X2F674_9BACT|nr:ROK family protein [Aeoliella straminimaris]MCO6042992.1 ROK family protein [Aeoliella straminimaris]
MTATATLLPIDQATFPLFAGIDVGGTNIKIGLVDDAGHPVAFEKIHTHQQQGAEKAAQRSAEKLTEMVAGLGIEPDQVARAGLATPGPMDLAAGKVLQPGNLPGWHFSPVRDLFSQATGLPVTFANDANAAAFGEFWSGAGAEVRNMVLVTLGTGVGGGIIIDGRLLVGAHGAGGEIGHIVIDCRDDATLNSLNLRGTLEGYCGAYGVLARARKALEVQGVRSSLSDLTDDALTPLEIAKAAEAGDHLAMSIILETAKLLAIGMASIIHTVDPESVVIGGAMTFGGDGHPLGERFLEEIRLQTTERIFESLRGEIHMDFARLGGDAGFIGAAGLAREEHLG